MVAPKDGPNSPNRPKPRNKSLPVKTDKSKLPAKTSAERTARRLTNQAVSDEVRDLKSQRREVSRDARHAKKEVRNQYQRGMGDLEATHATTQGYINAQNAAGQQAYTTAGIEQNAAQSALQNQLQNTYAAGAGSATDEMARLGLTGDTSSSFLNQLSADSMNSQSVAAQSGANAQTNLGMAQGNAAAVGNLIGSMNQGSLLSGMGKNLNSRNDQMDQVRTEEYNQKQLVREAIRDARHSRKNTFFQLLTQLKQSGWGK